jgi:hypothetical protein
MKTQGQLKIKLKKLNPSEINKKKTGLWIRTGNPDPGSGSRSLKMKGKISFLVNFISFL